MTYDTKKMILFGCEEKKRFLEELLKEYGKDASLEHVMQKKSMEEELPIEQCKFTGVAVDNAYAMEVAGDHDEFTGTIQEILESININLFNEEKEEIIDGLVKMFCCPKYWVDAISSNEFLDNELNVRCVPMDRAVTEGEVRAYLRKLAEEEEE